MTRSEFIQRAVLARFGALDGRLLGTQTDEFEEFLDLTISRAEALADKLQDGGEAPWSASDATGEESVGERLIQAVHGIGTAEAPLFVRQDPPVPLDNLGLRDAAEARGAENYVNDARAIVEVQLALNKATRKGETEDKAERRRMGGIRRVMESHAARRK
jgi:hypothetical protein